MPADDVPEPPPPREVPAVGLQGRVWALRSKLGPRMRRRARTLADLALGPGFGSWNFGAAEDRIAITLDDGPDPDVTQLMVERLDALGVRATFFLLTLRAERYPHLVDTIVRSGHEIALHGLDHRRVSEMSGRQALAYLSDARDRLQQVSGRPITMFRPPYGSQSYASVHAAHRAGMKVVVWNGDAADWEDRGAAEVVADADRASTPGGILLFHERLEPDPRHPDPVRAAPVTTFDRVAVVGDLIAALRGRGLEPCTVGELAGRGRMHRTAWLRP